jgi:CubicO group peptidase (beta-lactamase class C family)
MLQTAAPETVGFSSERLARINTLMQGYVERQDLPGIITLVSCRGKVIHQEKYGWMDVEASKPMRLDAIFNLASMEKTHHQRGGGLYGSIADYARFAQMLANGGEQDGVCLLSPKTAALFSMNHAPAGGLPYRVKDPLYHAGYGFGLGMRVLMDVSQSGMAGSVGEFGWFGALATYFWVDPRERLTGILLTQHAPYDRYPAAQQFKQLTYQALIE